MVSSKTSSAGGVRYCRLELYISICIMELHNTSSIESLDAILDINGPTRPEPCHGVAPRLHSVRGTARALWKLCLVHDKVLLDRWSRTGRRMLSLVHRSFRGRMRPGLVSLFRGRPLSRIDDPPRTWYRIFVGSTVSSSYHRACSVALFQSSDRTRRDDLWVIGGKEL